MRRTRDRRYNATHGSRYRAAENGSIWDRLAWSDTDPNLGIHSIPHRIANRQLQFPRHPRLPMPHRARSTARGDVGAKKPVQHAALEPKRADTTILSERSPSSSQPDTLV